MFEAIQNLFGNSNTRKLKRYREVVAQINALEPEMKKLQDADFPTKTNEFKQRLKEGASLEDLLPEAFALVREASLRINNERHFDVQLIGGIALHEGNIAEMQTGEGKTLASTCPAYLNALTGLGVHIVTPNDYLAKRDSQWMGRIYERLGLRVGLIQHGYTDEQRRENYGADITYGTNNEFGFDYLRDNMKYDLHDYVQRDFHFAIVDEVDSILIDEARTPLIISGPSDDNIEKYYVINQKLWGLTREIRKEEVSKLSAEDAKGIDPKWEEKEDHEVVRPGDYVMDEKNRSIALTENGAEKLEERLKGMLVAGTHLFDLENMETLHHVNQALKAHYLFKRDVDYVVQEEKVVIVDEFTGRLMPGRRFSDGLHQALEAKENVTIERENQTLATITFQNYFRMYKKLAGMTGTANTEKDEFLKIYKLGVVVIPTNRLVVRKDNPDVIYKTVRAKYKAVVEHIRQLHEKGQPVLVGTVSIEVSEAISRMLHQGRIPHQVLNAKHHEREAEIIAQAGRFKAVTIATNMAGRGTDIKLEPAAVEVGGLFVLGTGRHDSRRIDNQLRGRSGRQGDPGASQFYLSLEDDLLRIFGGERISHIMDRLKIEEDEPIEHVFISKAIENAQKKVEAHHFSARKHVLEFDDVMNRQRAIVYERRREILSDDINQVVIDMSEDVVAYLMDLHCESKYADQWDISAFNQAYLSAFQTLPKEHWEEEPLSRAQFLEMFGEHARLCYTHKIEYFRQIIMQGGMSEADFQHTIASLQRQILLNIADGLWKDHLLSMDHLREGIGLVGYAQKKPLDEYRKQAFALFADLMDRTNLEAISMFHRVQLASTASAPPPPPKPQELEMHYSHGEETPPKKEKQQPVKKQQLEIGRNDLCPCGSGKKYKKCHGQQVD